MLRNLLKLFISCIQYCILCNHGYIKREFTIHNYSIDRPMVDAYQGPEEHFGQTEL